MSQSVSLVLSSGGARGYAHVGVIEALERNGFSVSSVTGSSMGAVVGGIYAAGGLEHFKKWACALERTDVFKLYDFVFSSQGLIRGERVFKSMEEHIADRNIDDLPIPFQALATDLTTQQEIVISSGSLYSALKASSAIPAMVKPQELGDLELLDGGILSPLPINFAPKNPGDIIIAVDVNAKIPYDQSKKSKNEIVEDTKFNLHLEKLAKKWFSKDPQPQSTSKKKHGFFDLMMMSIDMMQDRITANILEQYPPDILVQISRGTCSTFDYYKAEKLIAEGSAAFEAALIKYNHREFAQSHR
jgi:NTE family protein